MTVTFCGLVKIPEAPSSRICNVSLAVLKKGF